MFLSAVFLLSGFFVIAQTTTNKPTPASSSSAASSTSKPNEVPPLDTNGDGKISQEEFNNHHAAKTFNRYDVNQDGKVTKNEVQQVNAQDSKNNVSGKVAIKHPKADTNNDGAVTMDEMNKTVQQSPEVKTIFQGINHPPQNSWVNQSEYDSWAGDESNNPGGSGMNVMSISF